MGSKIEKMSFAQLRNDDSWDQAVIVFDEKSWSEVYSLESRSYRISRDNKYFQGITLGNSLFGSALDGSDNGVRLDHYMHDWIIEYCYILK